LSFTIFQSLFFAPKSAGETKNRPIPNKNHGLRSQQEAKKGIIAIPPTLKF
jgi:hypothetical protein